jgi:hypothetical protein
VVVVAADLLIVVAHNLVVLVAAAAAQVHTNRPVDLPFQLQVCRFLQLRKDIPVEETNKTQITMAVVVVVPVVLEEMLLLDLVQPELVA